MSPAPSHEHPVARDTGLGAWLLADPDLAREARTAADEAGDEQSHGAWVTLRELVAGELEDRIVGALRDALPEPMGKVLVASLARYEILLNEARASLADPSATRTVLLADRTLHARHAVDIHADASVLRMTMPFVALVDFHLVNATARVSGGRLTGVALDDPRIDATVTAYEKKIGSRSATLRLGQTWVLDPPHPLLTDEEEGALRGSAAT